MKPARVAWNTLGIAAMCAAFAGWPVNSSGQHDMATGGARIDVLSSRPDAVTGGDALVRVGVPPETGRGAVTILAGGKDVTSAFEEVGAGMLIGLVSSLTPGRNTIQVRSNTGAIPLATLDVTNHPISGPVFSGTQQRPFVCETDLFVIPVVGGVLGPALDADCSIKTRVDYLYRSTAGVWKPLGDPSVRPADLASTTTTAGRTVKFVVRLETGTINRAVYQIALLHDPAVDSPLTPFGRTAGWNGRLVYTFGGGCGVGYHQGRHQGASLNVLDSTLIGNSGLTNGYAVAAASLNVFGVSCNDVTSAETVMMVKEHFIETIGPPIHTIGIGASGGSMQLHLIASNYPGILDGIIPARSFPDTLTFETPYQDCALLIHAFGAAKRAWTDREKAAVAGHRTFAYCSVNAVWGKLIQPTFASPTPFDTFPGCDSVLTPSLRYDRVANPAGTRCTLFDNMINVYGKDPRTGFARRPIDNVGVQYGLKAFNDGVVTLDQFIELNELAGGYDIDGGHVAERTVADPIALRTAHQTGRLNSGKGLAAIPIIDSRPYLDDTGDVHDAIRSKVMRARLIAANGRAANHVMITVDRTRNYVSEYSKHLPAMDTWLDNIAADTAPGSAAERVARNKPVDLVDACYTADGGKITDMAACAAFFPDSLEPRLAAGEPITNTFLKCSVKPVNPSDYLKTLTAAELERLRRVFPEGVCDYSKPGVEQQPPQGVWLRY